MSGVLYWQAAEGCPVAEAYAEAARVCARAIGERWRVVAQVCGPRPAVVVYEQRSRKEQDHGTVDRLAR